MSTERKNPWILSPEGILRDRETNEEVGTVFMRSGFVSQGSGWYGELFTAASILDDGRARGPFQRRKDAERETWQRYAQPNCEHESQQYGRCVRCGMAGQRIFTQRVVVDGGVFVDPETMEVLTAEQAGARAAMEITEKVETNVATVTIPKADAEALLEVLRNTRSGLTDTMLAMRWGREKKRLMDILIDRTQS